MLTTSALTAFDTTAINQASVDTVTVDLSLIIVSWNTRQLLSDCLRSVYESVRGISIEIFVVDNASTDGSPGLVRDRYSEAALIANTENVGFARANNQAIPKAKGRYVLLLNSDTVVPEGALNALVQGMDAHPEAVVCSPMLLNADSSPQFCWARFPGLPSELSGTLDLSQSPYPIADFADADKRAAMRPFAADWVGGACFLVRASALPAVGLLDEGYFMYSEETDWCRRFQEAGGKVLLVPAVTVTHLGGGSSRAVPLKTRERMYRSSLRFYRKSYGVVGAVLPSVVATIRYGLFHLLKRRGK